MAVHPIRLERDCSRLKTTEYMVFSPKPIVGNRYQSKESVFISLDVMLAIDRTFRECIPKYSPWGDSAIRWHDWDRILPALAEFADEIAETRTKDQFIAQVKGGVMVLDPAWERARDELCQLLAEFAEWVEARRGETDVIWFYGM